MFPFGKSFNYLFSPLVDDAPVALTASVPPASIYVYSSQPTRLQARDGSGDIIQTITPNTWTETDGYSRTITVAAIDDPDPNSESLSEEYWIAFNFRLQSGGQIQTSIRRLELERVKTHHNKSAVPTYINLQAIFKPISKYATESEVQANIETALTLVKTDLKSKGFRWSSVYRPDELSLAVQYKALTIFADGQKGDEFRERYDEWSIQYKKLISSINFEYDEDEDGSKDTKVSVSSSVFAYR